MNTTLTIFRQAGVWVVARDGRRVGEHRFKVDAEEAALQLAVQLRGKGAEAEVLVQSEFGEIQPIVDARRARANDRTRAAQT